MVITTAEVEDFREQMRNSGGCGHGAWPPACAITLPAAIELACAAKPAPAASTGVWLRQIAHARAGLRPLLAWLGGCPADVDVGAAQSNHELLLIGGDTPRSNHFHSFQERFKAALRRDGYSVQVSFALAGALVEMVENVVQHSGIGRREVTGMAGYVVDGGRMSFCVGDAGCGALESLRTNPAWAHLPDSEAALQAVIRDHASRRAGMGHGEGFKQLFKSLVDLNGWVRLRSGDALVELRQDARGRRQTVGDVVPSEGLQLTVTCARRALRQGEQEIVLANLT